MYTMCHRHYLTKHTTEKYIHIQHKFTENTLWLFFFSFVCNLNRTKADKTENLVCNNYN